MLSEWLHLKHLCANILTFVSHLKPLRGQYNDDVLYLMSNEWVHQPLYYKSADKQTNKPTYPFLKKL